MNERKVAILVVAAALLVPGSRGLAAQIVSKIEAGQYTVSDGVLPMSALRVAPTVQFDFPHASFRARGSAFLSEQALQLADGIVSGTFTSPTVYGVRAEMIGNASRAVDDRSLGNDQVDVQTRVHVLFRQHGGMWLGGGVARPWRVAVVSSARRDRRRRVGQARRRNAQVGHRDAHGDLHELLIHQGRRRSTTTRARRCRAQPERWRRTANLSMRPLFTESVGSGACERQSRFGDLEGVLHWDLGALELTAQAGHRFGDSYDVTADSRRWSSATATLWLNDRIAFVGGGGRQPALPLRGIPAQRASEWPGSSSPTGRSRRTRFRCHCPTWRWCKSFEYRTGTSGMQRIVIRVGGVETVDVMGDFSDWSPLTLVRHGRDTWELSIPMSAGTHQINVRVDGGPWMAPPNMPTMHDSFGGEVGLMVVSPDKAAH